MKVELSSVPEALGVTTSPERQHRPVIKEFRRWREDNQKLRIILSHIANMRPEPWDTWDSVQKRKSAKESLAIHLETQ